MQVRVLGEVDVVGEDGEPVAVGQQKLRQLVSVLALTEGPLTTRQLQTMLWGEADTQNMTSALTNSVMRLRERLPPGRLVHDEAGYRLVLDAEDDYLDIREFRELIATARRVRETYPRRSAKLLQQAVELWRDSGQWSGDTDFPTWAGHAATRNPDRGMSGLRPTSPAEPTAGSAVRWTPRLTDLAWLSR